MRGERKSPHSFIAPAGQASCRVLCVSQCLWATRGAHNPNLQALFNNITHESHTCSQHSFGLPLRMNGMHRM